MISTTELVYGLQGWASEGGIPERDAPVIRAFLTGLRGTEKGREHVYDALVAAQAERAKREEEERQKQVERMIALIAKRGAWT